MTIRHPLTAKTPAPGPGDTWPIRGGGSTGRVGYFGMTRDGGSKMHRGVDYLAPLGSPVFAIHAGHVQVAGQVSGFGLAVYLRSEAAVAALRAPGAPQLCTIYGHLAGLLVRVGDKVVAGQLLGFVGNTGNVPADCPDHVHVEVRLNGTTKQHAIDPEGFLHDEATNG